MSTGRRAVVVAGDLAGVLVAVTFVESGLAKLARPSSFGRAVRTWALPEPAAIGLRHVLPSLELLVGLVALFAIHERHRTELPRVGLLGLVSALLAGQGVVRLTARDPACGCRGGQTPLDRSRTLQAVGLLFLAGASLLTHRFLREPYRAAST